MNNAGGARGLEPVAEADVDAWRWMFETNVLGSLRMTKALLPALIAFAVTRPPHVNLDHGQGPRPGHRDPDPPPHHVT